MRPLIVSTLNSCRPLSRLGLPLLGSFGGGKSGFRRIDSHLQGRLVDLAFEVREPVADLLSEPEMICPAGASLTASATCPSICSIDSRIRRTNSSRDSLGADSMARISCEKVLAYLEQSPRMAPGKFATPYPTNTMSSPVRKTRRTWNEPGHVHFLTYSCFRRLPLLTRDRTRRWVLESLDSARQSLDLALWAYVIMPEHVHVVLCPRRRNMRCETCSPR
jgi:hypothetical protein